MASSPAETSLSNVCRGAARCRCRRLTAAGGSSIAISGTGRRARSTASSGRNPAPDAGARIGAATGGVSREETDDAQRFLGRCRGLVDRRGHAVPGRPALSPRGTARSERPELAESRCSGSVSAAGLRAAVRVRLRTLRSTGLQPGRRTLQQSVTAASTRASISDPSDRIDEGEPWPRMTRHPGHAITTVRFPRRSEATGLP